MTYKKFFVYILTNKNKTVLYIGITNDLERRISEHKADAEGSKKSFCGKYNCYFLIYYEEFQSALIAISREKELKGWSRKKKDSLINSENPDWSFIET